MSTFKLGDKLVCVRPGVDIGLVKDKVYTCFYVFTCDIGEFVILENMPSELCRSYISSRFRKALPSELEELEKITTL